MPQVIQGFLVTQLPKDPTAQSFPVVDNIPANSTQTIVYPNTYKGVAVSVSIVNQDGTNTCTFSVNGSTAITLSAGGQFNINDQNIVSVSVTTNAAGTGSCDIVAQVSPTYLDTESNRFLRDRG